MASFRKFFLRKETQGRIKEKKDAEPSLKRGSVSTFSQTNLLNQDCQNGQRYYQRLKIDSLPILPDKYFQNPV